MRFHVLLILLNEFRKRDKMRVLPSFYHLFAISLINSLIKEHTCLILYITPRSDVM